MGRDSFQFWIAIALCTSLASRANAQDTSPITAWVQRAGVCNQQNGMSVFEMEVGLTYTNSGNRQLIVPLFATISGLRAQQADGTTVWQSEDVLNELSALSRKFWAGAVPNPDHFLILTPGQRATIGSRAVRIPLSGGLKRTGVRPGQYLIIIEVDHSQRSPETAIDSQHWSDTGVLFAAKADAAPVRIQVPATAGAVKCVEPPTLLVR